jgi:hypothetical protein
MSKHPSFLCAAAVAIFSGIGSAASVYQLNGTLQNGAAVSGTVTIDTAAGKVTAANLKVSGVWSFNATELAQAPPVGGKVVIQAQNTIGPNASAVTIVLPVSTLAGYSGGNICTTAAICSGQVSSTALFSKPASQFTSGSLTAATTGMSLHALDSKGKDSGTCLAKPAQSGGWELDTCNASSQNQQFSFTSGGQIKLVSTGEVVAVLVTKPSDWSAGKIVSRVSGSSLPAGSSANWTLSNNLLKAGGNANFCLTANSSLGKGIFLGSCNQPATNWKIN